MGHSRIPLIWPPSAALPLKLRDDTAALGLLAFPLSPALQQRGLGFLQSQLGAVTPSVGLFSRPLLLSLLLQLQWCQGPCDSDLVTRALSHQCHLNGL